MEAKNKRCSQMATGKDNRFRDSDYMEHENKETLFTIYFKHGNYALMEKRIIFHRITYLKYTALTGETHCIHWILLMCMKANGFVSHSLRSQPGVLCLTRIKSVVNKSVLIKQIKSACHHLMCKVYNHWKR